MRLHTTSLLGLVLCVLQCVSTFHLGCSPLSFMHSPSLRTGLSRQCSLERRGPKVLLAKGAGLLDGAPRTSNGISSLVCMAPRVATSRVKDYNEGLGSSSETRRSSDEAPAAAEQDPFTTVILQQAKTAERLGNMAAAAEMYDSILVKQPENGKVWMKLFLLHKKAEDYSEARAVLQRALGKLPGNAILWQAWADMEWYLYKPAVARNLYKKGLEANSHLSSLYNAWGNMERDLGNTQKARELFVQGLKKVPKSPRLLFSLAILEDVEGNTKLAEKLLQQGLILEPNNPYLLHAMGLLEYKRGQVPAARAMFDRCLKADPLFTQAWLSWGRMEEEVGFVPIAREKYRQGCKADVGKGAVQVWQSLARLEEKAGKMIDAIDVYRRAVERHPRDTDLILEWGKLEEKRGYFNAAVRLYQRAIEAEPNRPYTYHCLGLLQARQQQYDSARELFSVGLKKAQKERKRGKLDQTSGRLGHLTHEGSDDEVQMGRREEANILHAWAMMEAKIGNLDKTRELFSRAVEMDCTQGWLWQSYARFEGMHGNEWLARHYFSQSVNAAPHDARTWRHWAEFEEKMGNEDRAQVYSRRSLQLSYQNDEASMKNDPVKPLLRRWVSGEGGRLFKKPVVEEGKLHPLDFRLKSRKPEILSWESTELCSSLGEEHAEGDLQRCISAPEHSQEEEPSAQ